MASIMAIVSKAIFNQEAQGLDVGDVWSTARYTSANKGLASLADGGDLYLVTVRPDDVLWLVAILRAPRQVKGGWQAAANTQPIASIEHLKSTLRFASGVGLPTKAGTLGMSLQTPRALTEEDIAQLAGVRTERGAKPRTAKPRAEKPRTEKPRTEKPRTEKPRTEKPRAPSRAEQSAGGLPALDAALAHLHAGRAMAALDDVLAAWRALRAPALGDLLALVSRQVDRALPPVAKDDWLDVATQRRPADVGRLVATLAETSIVRMKDRFELLLAFAPDPRIVGRALEIPPPFSYEAGPSMTRAFDMAERAGDVASRELVETAIAALQPQKGDSAARKEYLAKHRRRGEKVLAKLPATIAVPAAVKAQIAACTAACKELLGQRQVAKESVAKKSVKPDALLAEILANPEDDAPRVVYADALQQAGDPRGELIALQLAARPATEQRERALLKQHQADWLEPIGATIRPESVKFARGFLDACQVELKTEKQRALLAHPLWSTVRELDTTEMALATRADLKSLRRATLDPAALSTLARRDEPVLLEAVIGRSEMRYGLRLRPGMRCGANRAVWKPALAVGALEKLTSLQLDSWNGVEYDTRRYASLKTPADWAWLLGSKLGKQLTDVDLFAGHSTLAIAPWIEHVMYEQPRLRVTLRFTNGNTASGSKEYLATFHIVASDKTARVSLSLNQDTGDPNFRYYSIGGQISTAIAGVSKRLAPSITVRYTGSKKREVMGFPGIAKQLRGAFANVVLT